MKRHLSSLAVVMFFVLPGLVLPLPANVGAEGGLRLKSVEFPREFEGECDAVFRVDGDLSSARDFEAKVEYLREHK